MATTIVVLALVATLALSLPLLTVLGAHRRGLRWPLAVAAGLIFPLTWVVWYVHDEHPYARAD